jgi:hypothetical protein
LATLWKSLQKKSENYRRHADKQKKKREDSAPFAVVTHMLVDQEARDEWWFNEDNGILLGKLQSKRFQSSIKGERRGKKIGRRLFLPAI